MKVAAARWCYFFSQVPGEMHYVPSTTRRITAGASNPGWGRKTQGSLVIKIFRLKSKADQTDEMARSDFYLVARPDPKYGAAHIALWQIRRQG
jgi:hypothetical protein